MSAPLVGETLVRVLIADDTPEFRKLMELGLERSGRFEVVAQAGDGAEAVELARIHSPDVVLLDLAMPVMDGFEALPEIRRALPDSRIVVLSGFNGAQMGPESLELGADLYVEKGVSMNVLVRILLEASGRPLRESEAHPSVVDLPTARQLRLYEERFRRVFDDGSIGIVLAGPNLQIFDVNEAFCEMLGYPKDELLARSLVDITHPDDVERTVEMAQKLFGGHIPGYQMEKRYLTRSGETVWANLSASVVRDEDGSVLYAIGMVEDRTHRRRAEEARDEADRRFRSLVESAVDAIVLADEEGRIVSWNPGAERIFGHRESEVLGEPLTVLMPERYRDNHRRGIANLRSGGDPHIVGTTVELSGLRSDGTEFPLELSLAWWESAGRAFYSGIIRDLTDRKQAAEDLRQTEARRRAELERSNAELDQFAYTIAHDLQEPLRVVSGFAELLIQRYEERIDTEGQEFLAYIGKGVSRMQTMIEGLLEYARAGSESDLAALGDAETALSGALAGLQTAIEESQAVVTHDPLPAVALDGELLVRLLQNLVGNGIKFCRDAAPRVHVGAERQEDWWVFSVEDNGIGIEPEYSDQVFGVFRRLVGRDEYAGTGIGLAICKRIVERHGGRIWLTSTPGRGTKFHFTVPAASGGGR